MLERGITPAYAGKSCNTFGIRFWNEDHPRLCGEKALEASEDLKDLGSPPPMRGKVKNGRAYTGRHRITPAYAGKS